jgi:O-antigen ligase
MIIAAVLLPALCLNQTRQTQDLAARWALIASCLVLGLLLVETLFDMPLLRTARYYVNGELFVNGLPPLEERRTDVTYFQELYLANRLSHIASIAAILVLPVAGILWQRNQRFGAVAAFVVGCAGVALVPTQTPMLALLLGLAVASIMLIPKIGQSRRLGVALASLVAIGVVTSPWLAQTAYSALHDALASSDISIIHRVAIWDYTAGFIAERPIAGYGIEAARTLGREGANLAELVPGHPYAFQALPLHPHNASIQIWLELGGVGALILALFLFAMTRTVHAYADQPVARATLMAGLVVGLAVAHLSYGIWQYWWVASLGMIYAMLALVFASERTS